jgi:hypothetical protein
VEALLEARKGKNLTRAVAVDAVTNDPNMFGVLMVAMGDAGGMVSGSVHTTAATIRPAMQVLRTPSLVSSVFFMCLPDKVGLCGVCCATQGGGACACVCARVVSCRAGRAERAPLGGVSAWRPPRTQLHARAPTRSAHSQSRTRACVYTHTCTRTHTPTHPHTHTRIHPHTHTRTRTHTHTRTRARRCWCTATAPSTSRPAARTSRRSPSAAQTRRRRLASSRAWRCCPTPPWARAQAQT